MSKPVWRTTPSSLPPRPIDDVAQRAVVDVEHAPPRDVVEVEAELVAVVEVAVDHRRQQVVGGGDGVEVAGQVEVEQLHRDHLAVAAAGSAALDAERRPHRRLPQRDHGVLADVLHRLAEPDRGGGLALAERRRRDRRDDDVLGRGPVGELVDRGQADLGELDARTARAGARRSPSSRRSPAAAWPSPVVRSRDRLGRTWTTPGADGPRLTTVAAADCATGERCSTIRNRSACGTSSRTRRARSLQLTHGTSPVSPARAAHRAARAGRRRASSGLVGRSTRAVPPRGSAPPATPTAAAPSASSPARSRPTR